MKATIAQVEHAVEDVLCALDHMVVENAEDLEISVTDALDCEDPTTITITHHVRCFMGTRAFRKALRPYVEKALKELDEK